MYKNKLMKYAYLYLADQMEAYNETLLDPEKRFYNIADYMKAFDISFKYEHLDDGHRQDAVLTIIELGDMEAQFTMNICR